MRGQRATCRNQFSPTMWVPGIQLRSWDLAVMVSSETSCLPLFAQFFQGDMAYTNYFDILSNRKATTCNFLNLNILFTKRYFQQIQIWARHHDICLMIITVLQSWGQRVSSWEISLGYIVRPCSNKQKRKHHKFNTAKAKSTISLEILW